MIIEYIRYDISESRAADFEAAYARAAPILAASPHLLSCEIARGVEEPRHYVVRLE